MSPPCKRVAIFFWDGHLAVAPSLVSALQLLAAAGYEVDVFIRGLGDAIGPLGEIPPGVHIFDLASARRLSSGLSRRWLPARLGVAAGVFLYLVFAWKQARRRHYSAIFGVDAIGGYCGQRIASWFRLPFFYWSLELLFARDARRLYERLLIHCGRVATRHARWIVIQDSERAKALLAENQPGHERILLVPNGPAGPANLGSLGFPPAPFPHSPRNPHRPACRHDRRLGLVPRHRRSIHAWPPEFCMVMHSNEPRRADEPDIRRSPDVGEPRLILSLDPVAASDVDDLISSASVGLATYGKGLGPNWDLIVYASGKLGHYLRNGLPVICSDHPGMRELMAQYRCGIVIENVDEIAAALSEISSNYAAYRAGAFDCYRRRYEFSAHFRAVLDALARECGAPVEHTEKVLAWK